MSKKSLGPGRCVHCLREVEGLTSDHVIPESWYPGSTPLDLEKWQAPACSECNSESGKVEAKLLEYMGLCVDPESEAAEGIGEKALRAFDPTAAGLPQGAHATEY